MTDREGERQTQSERKRDGVRVKNKPDTERKQWKSRSL